MIVDMKTYQRHYQKTSPNARAARKRYYAKNRDKWKTYSKRYLADPTQRAKTWWMAARSRAKKEGIEFTITLEDIYPFPDVCPVLGIPMAQASGTIANSPSIDRIDPTKGYTKDNIKVISYRANALKNDGTLEEMQKIVQYMSIYTKDPIDKNYKNVV